MEVLLKIAEGCTRGAWEPHAVLRTVVRTTDVENRTAQTTILCVKDKKIRRVFRRKPLS